MAGARCAALIRRTCGRGGYKSIDAARRKERSLCVSFHGGKLPAESEAIPTTRKNISAAADRFVKYRRAIGGWTAQAAMQSRATFRLFTEHCGDRPARDYSRRDLASFYNVLRELPALYAKSRRFAKLAPAAIVELTNNDTIERLSMTTIKRHFSALSQLFEYFRSRGEYEPNNPAHGFSFQKSRKSRANAGRMMWEGDKLRDLFASPVWTGCASESRRSTPGWLILKDEKYWLPLLALYHGNRLEEFAQLRRGDIGVEDGIWFFDINDEGDKQLKNSQSIRRVPMHPKLIELGFLNHLNGKSAPADVPVFPLLKPGGPDKKFGFYFTKWWTRYRRDIGLYEKGLDYHSFRHGVTTKLFAANVPEVVIDALTGHEGGGTSRRVYLKRLPLTPPPCGNQESGVEGALTSPVPV
jgi:integrase